MFGNNLSAAPSRALQPDVAEFEPSGLFLGAGGSNQPTYTTVGSIYRPKQAAPLQPPTRRPRARRYPQPIHSPSGETFFPNDLLSALALGDQPPSPPTATTTLQHYAPLQQNSYRAVSPAVGRDQTALPGLEVPLPSMLLGNSPFPIGYEGNDNMGSEDTLAHLTVKGITNLASFPNPMQKAARDALARARTTNVSLDRSDTPLSVMSTNVDFPKDRVSGSYGAIPVPGPPQPLTAGPPGQRQFKPLTGENTSKAPGAENLTSQMLSNASTYQSITPIGPPPTIGSNFLAGVNGDDIFASTGQPVRPSLDQSYHEHVLHHVPEFKEFRRTPGPPESNTERTRRKVHDTLPPDAVKQYFPRGFPSNYDGRHQPMTDDWTSNYPAVEGMRGQKPFSEQLNSINRSFYAGTEGLVRNMEQIVRDHNYRCLENKVGVIGEERQRLRGSHIERLGADGKVQPPLLTLEEVEGMDEDEVTKPLINMAYASVLRYKEEGQSAPSSGWSSGFVPAEDDWVDSTEEGNNSFFSSPKEEQLKKRRIPRRARRGY